MKITQYHFPHSWNRIFILVLIFFVSMSAGFLGGLLAPREAGPLTLEDMNIRPIVLEDRTKIYPIKNDAQAIISSVRPSILFVYMALRNEETKKSYERIYTSDLFKGYALAATADGWLIAPQAVERATRIQDIRIIDQDKNVYGVEKKIDDPALPVSYLKINAKNLKPITFAVLDSLTPGVSVTLFKNSRTIESISISGPEYKNPKTVKEAITHTDTLDKVFNSDEAYTSQGLPIVTQEGEVIGSTNSNGIIPFGYIKETLPHILRTGMPIRHTLKLAYLDTAWVMTMPNGKKDGILPLGALLVSDRKTISFPSGGKNITLFSGDIITSVNDESVNERQSLSELLTQYKPGDTVRFTIRRNGVTIEQSIILP